MGIGINIGSTNCRQCINCITNNREDFIKCKLKPEGKAKKTERFKRDKYGVISETENNDYCDLCIYTNELASSGVCQHCTNNNKSNEYYSSK